MDIYAYAEQTGSIADYYDQQSGRIYHVAAYNQARRFGLPTIGIGVSDLMTGEFLGYAQRLDTVDNAEPSTEESTDVNDENCTFELESGILYAPAEIQQWFEKNPAFRIAAILRDSISFAPVDSQDCSDWITVHGKISSNSSYRWTELAHLVGKKSFPDYIGISVIGGNANADNGGYSVCCWKTSAREKKSV